MKPGRVRIIAGKLRGRQLKVISEMGLRPTPDRVRETVFNWLNDVIPGAYCLDMYCGSGALGFEALSRGAKAAVMVDQSPQVVSLLTEEKKILGVENANIYCARLPEGLLSAAQPFDIVFIDPPYQQNLLLPSCQKLENENFLAASAYIYLEAERLIEDNELPNHWRLLKSKQAGQVYYHLAKREF